VALSSLAERVLAGDPKAIARAISLVEDEAPDAGALLAELHPRTGRAWLVGLTGAPGVGKSTLADRLTAEIRSQGLTVGILAIDPTSPFTGVAILGDRITLGAHAGDAGVFVRSMATRGQLGGLARATGDAALVLDAAGRDVVIIETVGVGQGEVDIVRTADVSIVVLVPGTGDDVQAIKAGIMEIADIFVVNKADRDGADRTVQSVAAALALQTHDPRGWRPPIVQTVATTGGGVPELWAALTRFRESPAAGREERRRGRYAAALRDRLVQRLLRHVEESLPAGEIERSIERVAAREIDPLAAADELVKQVIRS